VDARFLGRTRPTGRDQISAPAKPASAPALTITRHRMPDPQTLRPDFPGMPAMTGDSVSIKHAAAPMAYLTEQMTVQRLTEVLAALPFNSHEEAKVVLDPGVQAFLLAATRAAAADPDAKIRRAWRSIKEPLR